MRNRLVRNIAWHRDCTLGNTLSRTPAKKESLELGGKRSGYLGEYCISTLGQAHSHLSGDLCHMKCAASTNMRHKLDLSAMHACAHDFHTFEDAYVFEGVDRLNEVIQLSTQHLKIKTTMCEHDPIRNLNLPCEGRPAMHECYQVDPDGLAVPVGAVLNTCRLRSNK